MPTGPDLNHGIGERLTRFDIEDTNVEQERDATGVGDVRTLRSQRNDLFVLLRINYVLSEGLRFG